MRRTRIDLQGGVLHDFRRHAAGLVDRDDLVVVAVKDQRRYVDLLQVSGVVDLRELLDTFVLALNRAKHAFAPELVDRALRDFRGRVD